MKYIIANWKANKNIEEANRWINSFLKNDFSKIRNKVAIIICPPSPFIPFLKEKVKKYPFIKIGAQDLSRFEGGAYTAEVTAKTLFGLINYVIIGHSERRKYFNENTKILFEKFVLAKKNGIEPLFCIRNKKDSIPLQTKFVVYEPIYAISNGSGQGSNEPLEKVLTMKKILKLDNHVNFIYGGSVNEKNANQYLKNKEIDGVLVGGASLNPDKFYKIANYA
jgi:triosephosphate isomerase